MQPPAQPQRITRRYFTDDAYTADAAQMTASGWRVVGLAREPDGAVVATYAFYGNAAMIPPPWGAPPKHKSVDRRMFFLGAGIGGFVLLMLLVAVIVAHLNPTPSGSPNGALLSPTATSAARPTTNVNAVATILANDPTSSPAAALVSGPRLGGPIEDFNARYGSDNPPSPVYLWDTTLDGVYVQITVTLSRTGESLDNQYRATEIAVSTPLAQGNPWSSEEDATLVSAFLPPDAHHTSNVAGFNDFGPDHIYTSQQLANSLSGSLFQSEATGQQVAPGTFNWQCSTTHPFCDIRPGTLG